MWTILGFPLCSVAVPVWIGGRDPLPSVLMADETGNAPLCDMVLKLKKKCFPIQRGSGNKYLNLTALLNQEGSGILQRLQPLENKIIKETEKHIKKWRIEKIDAKEIQNYYRWLDKTILEEYQHQFDL